MLNILFVIGLFWACVTGIISLALGLPASVVISIAVTAFLSAFVTAFFSIAVFFATGEQS